MISATAIEISEAQFAPFLRRASRRLGRRLDRAEFLYNADAIHRQLLLPLVVTAQTMTLEMDIARLADALPIGTPERELVGRDPMLSRQLVIAARQWLRTASRLVERIADDWEHIQARFGPIVSAGPVIAIRLDLDGRRRGGSPTAEVTWSGGLRLVYCPRPMAVELVVWLNAHGLSTPLRSPDVLDRGEYSWTRSVESAPSAD